MAQKHGPSIVKNGLVLALDASDKSSYNVPTSVEVLVVAGGGGGGMDMGGGGGGGGVVYNSKYNVSKGDSITVTVGAGGWGAPAGSGGYRGDGVGPQPSSHQFTIPATNGGNSVFGTITAIGGGKGGSSYYGYTPDYAYGADGGSGGGAGGYTAGGSRPGGAPTAGQGYRGGTSGGGSYYSAGGGGASAPGVDGPNTPNGGDGIQIPEMSPYWFAGGGGGGSHSGYYGGNGGKGGGGGGGSWSGVGGTGDTNGINPGVTAANGPYQFGGNAGANTGGGGGGGTHYNYNNGGGNGGSGIVIVRYPGPQAATGGTIETKGGYTYHTFTSSGTFAVGNSTTWRDVSGNGRNFTWNSVDWNPLGYFNTSGRIASGPASNSFGITNTSGYTIFTVFKTNSGSPNALFKFYSDGGYGRAIFVHPGWTNETLYFDQGGCCDDNQRTSVNVSGLFGGPWNIVVFRSLVNQRNIFRNGTLIATNSTAAANINLNSTGVQINPNDEGYNWDGQIAYFSVYNRGLTQEEYNQNFIALKTRFGL
jgi:hypothetical protein